MCVALIRRPACTPSELVPADSDKANRICLQDTSLWAVLAGWAVSAGEVNTAEVAFAGCEEVDKLQYMLYINQLPTKEARLAELALYRHNPAEAEAILLQVAVATAKACKLCLYVGALSVTYGDLVCWLKPNLYKCVSACLLHKFYVVCKAAVVHL